MAKLTGQTIAASYDQLLIVGDADGISSSLQAVESADTGGSSSALSISTVAISVDGTLTQDAGNVVFNEAGADYDFRVESDDNANMLFIDGANDATLIGTSTFRNNLFNTTLGSAFQVEGTTDQGGSLMVTRNAGASASNQPFIALCKSRGSSLNSNTIISDNDLLGSLSFQGSDGTQFVEAASITAKVGDTPGANDMPGKLLFNITKNAEASGTEMMKIDAVGDVTVSTGNLVIPTAGKGISFTGGHDPDTTGTATSNVLDDYEEGTFTPAINEAGGSLTATGFYTKIGNAVHFSISMQDIGSTGSASTVLSNLPFTSSSTSGRSGGAFLVQTEKIDYSGVGHLNFGISTNVTQFSMNFAADDGTRILCTNAAFNDANAAFQIVGTYFV